MGVLAAPLLTSEAAHSLAYFTIVAYAHYVDMPGTHIYLHAVGGRTIFDKEKKNCAMSHCTEFRIHYSLDVIS